MSNRTQGRGRFHPVRGELGSHSMADDAEIVPPGLLGGRDQFHPVRGG